MSTMYGADVAQLRSLAGTFDRLADQLDHGRTAVGNAIQISAWVGPYASSFRHQWAGEHSTRMAGAVATLRGAAKQLRANADGQERASAVDGGSTAVSVSGHVLGAHTSQPMTASSVRPWKLAPIVPPSFFLRGMEGVVEAVKRILDQMRREHDFRAWEAGAIGNGIDYDNYAGNQCVDVAKSYAASLFPDVDPAVINCRGNGNQIYENINPDYFEKLPPSATPQPGDIICIDSNPSSPTYGHVAVVSKVENGVVTVVQQNGSNPNGVVYEATLSQNTMKYVQGYLRPKHPES